MSSIYQKGFTIIEVLTVVVIIGVLAAIAVVAYNGTQNKAYDSAVRSDLDATGGLLENFRVSAANAGHDFPQSTSELSQVGLKASKKSYKESLPNNFVYCINTSDYQSYAIAAESKSGNIFLYTQDGFQNTSIDEGDFSDPDSICNSLSLSYIASGLSSANTWQTWMST